MFEDFGRYFERSQRAICAFARHLSGDMPPDVLNAELRGISGRSSAELSYADIAFMAEGAQATFASGESEGRRIKEAFPKAGPVWPVHLGFARPTSVKGDAVELCAERFGVRDFVLCVGRLESRKNQLMLLHALRDDDIPLVFVNSSAFDDEYGRLCRAYPRRGRTIFTGRVDAETLCALYAAARVHALPSWYELPGLVSLEAAWAGCEVVAPDWGTLPSYLGDLVHYCDPSDPDSIRRAVLAALGSSKASGARDALAQCTWESAAQRVLGVYEDVAAACATEVGAERLRGIRRVASMEEGLRARRRRAMDMAFTAPGDSLRLATGLLRQRPGNPSLLYCCGVAHTVAGQFIEAERCLKAALKLQPFLCVEAYLYLALGMSRQGRPGEVLRVVDNVARLFPFVQPEHFSLLEQYRKQAVCVMERDDGLGVLEFPA